MLATQKGKMPMAGSRITINGLTPLELRELEQKLGKSAVEEGGNLGGDQAFPEPATLVIATIALSSLALNALAIILSRPKAVKKRKVTLIFEDGYKKTTAEYEEETQAVGPPPADVVEKIGKALAFDPKSLPDMATLN
jgi:hypothetical protein